MVSSHLPGYLNPSLYLANSGIPLFTQSVQYQVLLLIPIIAIEAYAHQKILNLSIPKATYLSLIANLVSTLVGGVLVLFIGAATGQFLFGTSVPVQPGAFPFLPIEIIVTLIPMFFISVAIEVFIGNFGLKQVENSKINQSFLIANAFTYSMLMILAITQLIKGYIEGRG